METTRRSIYTTNQSYEPACYGHAVARCLSRFLRLRLGIESTYTHGDTSYNLYLYNTYICKNKIFRCLEKFQQSEYKIGEFDPIKGRPLAGNEIVSVLLFYFIYKVVVKEYGCGGNSIDSIKHFFNYIKSNVITEEYIINIFIDEITFKKEDDVTGHNEDHVTEHKIENYKDDIKKLSKMLNQIKLLDIKPSFFITKFFKHMKIEEVQFAKNMLKYILAFGYYAFLAIEQIHEGDSKIEGHLMCISNYNQSDSTLKIKNSYGDNSYSLHLKEENYIKLPLDTNNELIITIDQLISFQGNAQIVVFFDSNYLKGYVPLTVFIEISIKYFKTCVMLKLASQGYYVEDPDINLFIPLIDSMTLDYDNIGSPKHIELMDAKRKSLVECLIHYFTYMDTFYLNPIYSIKDGKINEDFELHIKYLLLFILVKAGIITDNIFKDKAFDISKLRSIQLDNTIGCKYDGYNLSICEVLNHFTNLYKLRGEKKIYIQPPPQISDSSHLLQYRIFKETTIPIVDKIFNTLLEENIGFKASRYKIFQPFHKRVLTSHQRSDLKTRGNRYRLKRWVYRPFSKYGGKITRNINGMKISTRRKTKPRRKLAKTKYSQYKIVK